MCAYSAMTPVVYQYKIYILFITSVVYEMSVVRMVGLHCEYAFNSVLVTTKDEPLIVRTQKPWYKQVDAKCLSAECAFFHHHFYLTVQTDRKCVTKNRLRIFGSKISYRYSCFFLKPSNVGNVRVFLGRVLRPPPLTRKINNKNK